MTVMSFRKRGHAIFPADTTAEAMLGKIADGDIFLMKSHRARNPQHHRKFFALLDKIHEHLSDEVLEAYPTTDKLLIGIKYALGYMDTMMMPNGDVIKTPKSIAFESLDQTGFETFYQRVMRLACDQLLPGVTDAELEAEIAAEIR